MDRVIGHRQVADADAHLVAFAYVQGVDAGEHAAVPAPQIEVQHRHDLGRCRAGIDVESIQQEAEVAVNFVDQRMFGFRVRDPQAHHAHRHLRHFVGMRVVHEGAGAARDKLINEGLAGLDAGLVQPGNPIHAIGQALAVPVDARVLRQLVGDEDAHAVTFHHFDGRPGRLAVVAPQMSVHARC